MKTKLLFLSVALFAATNLFAAEFEKDGIAYNILTENTVEVTRNNYSGSIVIPEKVTYNSTTYSVTTIGYDAFDNCISLTSVTIGNSVTTIGDDAFWGCSGLTSVTIPNSVTTIGDDAFERCIGLTSVTIPNSVTTIGDYAFHNCSGLTSVTIGNSVTTIGGGAFSGCSGLTKTNYTGTIADWCKIEFENYFSNPIFYSNNFFINDVEVKALIIPEGVDAIGDYAFWDCRGLTSVTIPNSVTTIGEWAFYDCSGLTSITIGNSVKTIGNDAFYSCSGLISITIPNSVTTIGECAFAWCSGLTSVTAPAIYFDVQEEYWPSYSKHLTSVVVTGGELTENALLYINRSYKTLKTLDVSVVTNTEFADEAFKGYYNLESLTLPQTLERVGYMMVAGCKNLKSIDIPASVVEIDQSAFEDCRSIQTITFGGQQPTSAPSISFAPAASTSQLKKIGNWAFYNAHELQNLALPEGVEEIGEGAFYGCVYLEDLILPRSIKTIGDNGFSLCSKLSKITVCSLVPPTIAPKTFYDVKRQIPVYVPIEVVDAYKQTDYWKEFNIIGIEMPTDLESVHDSQPTMHKYFHNGQILLERNNTTYTLMGQKVR